MQSLKSACYQCPRVQIRPTPFPPNSQPHPQPTQQRDHFVIEDCSFLLSSPLDTTMKSCLNLLSKDNRTQRDIAGLHLFLSRPWFD